MPVLRCSTIVLMHRRVTEHRQNGSYVGCGKHLSDTFRGVYVCENYIVLVCEFVLRKPSEGVSAVMPGGEAVVIVWKVHCQDRFDISQIVVVWEA